MAVFPSAESATAVPWSDGDDPVVPLPTSLACSTHVVPLRTHTHAAPMSLLSPEPPTIAVAPSAESATAWPIDAKELPTIVEGMSGGPSRSHTTWRGPLPSGGWSVRRQIHAEPS